MKMLKIIKGAIFTNKELRRVITHGIAIKDNNVIEINPLKKEVEYDDSIEIVEKNTFNSPSTFPIIDELMKTLPTSEISSAKTQYLFLHGNSFFHGMKYFFEYGQKILKLKDSAIIGQIENTDVGEIKFKDIEMPFGSFYISLEKTIRTKLELSTEFVHHVDGVFIINQKETVHVRIIYKLESYSFTDKSTSFIGFVSKTVSINKNIPTMEAINEAFKKEYSAKADTYHKITFPILKSIVLDTLKIIMFYNVALSKKKDVVLEEIDNTKKLIAKNSSPRELKRYSDCNYTYLLSNKSASNKDFAEQLKIRGAIEKKFIVSGHFRNQPYKEDRETIYKLIWIEPFFKGKKYSKDENLKIIVA